MWQPALCWRKDRRATLAGYSRGLSLLESVRRPASRLPLLVLILGISKLRQGGRFGFITTEYWLRAAGARVLREYVAGRCRIDRILLFRNMRLFPAAPGQHSMILIGQRAVGPDQEHPHDAGPPDAKAPLVSVYQGDNVSGPARDLALTAFREGRSANGVHTFRSRRSPNQLGADSWSEVVLPPTALRRRERLRRSATPLEFVTEEGVLTSADALRGRPEEHLPAATLTRLGWPDRRAGIFVLQPDEVEALGRLTESERAIVRPVVNSRDVYPYAAVLPNAPERMIYLPRPPALQGRPVDQIRRASFPDDLPALEEHLTQFRPLLEANVQRYGE